MNTWIKPDERLPENADRILVIRKGFKEVCITNQDEFEILNSIYKAMS